MARLKTNYLLSLLSGVLCAVSLNTLAVESTGLSLDGEVKDNACTFESGQTVVLEPVLRQNFSGRGSVIGVRSLDIELKNCGTGAGNVDVTAEGTGVSENEYAFANTNTGDGAAEGVGIYFYQGDGKIRFRPDGAVTQAVTTLSPSQDNTLTFRAGYVALTENPVAGSLNAVVNIVLSYK